MTEFDLPQFGFIDITGFDLRKLLRNILQTACDIEHCLLPISDAMIEECMSYFTRTGVIRLDYFHHVRATVTKKGGFTTVVHVTAGKDKKGGKGAAKGGAKAKGT